MSDNDKPIVTTAEAELLDEAWGVIANAGGGNWDNEPLDWRVAAHRWRNRYHEWLRGQRLAMDAATLAAALGGVAAVGYSEPQPDPDDAALVEAVAEAIRNAVPWDVYRTMAKAAIAAVRRHRG